MLPKNSCKSMKSDTNQLDSKGVTECGSKNTAFYQVDCGNTAYTYHSSYTLNIFNLFDN